MARRKPLILALANPTPEIMPDAAKAVRPDAILATGRSDFPNQVNNVLCFPYIFRGALDVGATTINEEMKIACVKAIADLAMAEPSERGDPCLRRPADALWPRVPDSQAFRSPADHPDCPGGGESSHGNRRGYPTDYGYGGLHRALEQLRLPYGVGHAAGDRKSEARSETPGLCRGRGAAGAAGGAAGGRRRYRLSPAGGPAGGYRGADRGVGAAAATGKKHRGPSTSSKTSATASTGNTIIN